MIVSDKVFWRGRCDRVVPLIDGMDYFTVLAQMMEQAERRVLIVGWDFRTDTVLDPETGEPLKARFERLLRQKPELEIHVLIWDWIVGFAMDREPLIDVTLSGIDRLHFHFDSAHPPSAAHHEKIVVIDGTVGFVGGIDITRGRIDDSRHRSDNPLLGGAHTVHDLMFMVECAAPLALEKHVLDRWRIATGRVLDPTPPDERRRGELAWPKEHAPWWRGVQLAIVRTKAALEEDPEIREIEPAIMDAIGAARETLYIENQYFTMRSVVDALQRQLQRHPKLEVVIVLPKMSPSLFENLVMDTSRADCVRQLRDGPHGDRVAVVYPRRVPDDGGEPHDITVHSKTMIVDDRLVMNGSANLAHRSMGLDTEVSLILEAEEDEEEARAAMRRLRMRLLGEHLGLSPEETVEALSARPSMVGLIAERSDATRRLEPIGVEKDGWIHEVAAAADLRSLDSDTPLDIGLPTEDDRPSSGAFRRSWFNPTRMRLTLASAAACVILVVLVIYVLV